MTDFNFQKAITDMENYHGWLRLCIRAQEYGMPRPSFDKDRSYFRWFQGPSLFVVAE